MKYIKVIEDTNVGCFEQHLMTFINTVDVDSIQYSFSQNAHPHYTAMVIYTEKNEI